MDLTPTPSFTTFCVMWFIRGWMTPFHPQSVLATVPSLGIVLGCSILILVMAGFLSLRLMAIWGVVGQVGTTCVTPVFPLAPWSIGVSHRTPGTIPRLVTIGRRYGQCLSLALVLAQCQHLLN